MELTVKDVLKMEKVMSKVKDVVSNSTTITDHKNSGSIRLTECMMPEFDGFDICYLPNNKEETGSYLGSFFIENVDSDKPKMVYYDDAYEEKGKKEIPLYEANENPTVSYENYQLQWMMDHGYSLIDLMRSMEEYFAEEDTSNRSFEDLFNEWQDEYGFHHELWACKEEAMDAGECMDHPIKNTKDENDNPNYLLVYYESGHTPYVSGFMDFDDAHEVMSMQYDQRMQKHFVNKKNKERSYCGNSSAQLYIYKKTYTWNIKTIDELPILALNVPEKKEYLLICSGELTTMKTKHFRTAYSAEKAMEKEFEQFKEKYHPNSSKEEQKKYDKLSEVRSNHAILYYRNEDGNEDTFNWRIVEREKC